MGVRQVYGMNRRAAVPGYGRTGRFVSGLVRGRPPKCVHAATRPVVSQIRSPNRGCTWELRDGARQLVAERPGHVRHVRKMQDFG